MLSSNTATTWLQLYGAALLCGIGFTMSLFIGALAFPGAPEAAEAAKLGTLAGSLLSAVAGWTTHTTAMVGLRTPLVIYPLQALVTENMGTSGTAMVTPNVRMSGIVIAILPLVALYPFFREHAAATTRTIPVVELTRT